MNKSNNNNKAFLLIAGMILLAAFSRLIPHWPNFTATGAIALFGAAYFSKKYLALIVPVFALWLSDLAINNIAYAELNESFVWFQSYQLYTIIPMIAIVLFGSYLFKKITALKVLGGSIVATAIFFLVSNFGTWLSPFSIFSPDAIGLVNTYVAGLPFALNSLLGNLFFSTVMFASYSFITKFYPTLSLNLNKPDYLSE